LCNRDSDDPTGTRKHNSKDQYSSLEGELMAALAIAFACVWIGVALYVGWLGHNQRQLARDLKALAKSAGEARDKDSNTRKAA
jgi:CcmD family protein